MSDKSKAIIINTAKGIDQIVMEFSEFIEHPEFLEIGSVNPSTIQIVDKDDNSKKWVTIHHVYYLLKGRKWFYFTPDRINGEIDLDARIYSHGIKNKKAHCRIYEDELSPQQEIHKKFLDTLDERRTQLLYENKSYFGYVESKLSKKDQASINAIEDEKERNEAREQIYFDEFSRNVKPSIWYPSKDSGEIDKKGNPKLVSDESRPHVSYGTPYEPANSSKSWMNAIFCTPLEKDDSGHNKIPYSDFIPDENKVQRIRAFKMIPALTLADFIKEKEFLPLLKIREADVWKESGSGGAKKSILHKSVINSTKKLIICDTPSTNSGAVSPSKETNTLTGKAIITEMEDDDDIPIPYEDEVVNKPVTTTSITNIRSKLLNKKGNKSLDS